MSDLKEFCKKYPNQTIKLSSGKPFTFRYYKNPHKKATVVLLPGGIGLSDLFYLHFERFTRNFSILTFDYQIQFSDNTEFAGAVAELLQILIEKVWLVGQSLGGIVAQIIAKNYPQNIKGLVLSNTCSLSKEMGSEAYSHIQKMIESQEKSKKILSLIPFGLFKRLMKWTVMKTKTGNFGTQEKELMENLCDSMLCLLTKEYEFHMIDFLVDAKNHFGMTADDFSIWADKVLLILSEDDNTFDQASKEALISIMTKPTVITDITGGHLALLIKLEKYADVIERYILQRTI